MCEGFFEFPDVAHAGVWAIEVDGGGRPDKNVHFSWPTGGPTTGGYRRPNDLLFGGGEDVSNVEMTEGIDVHPGRHVRLRIEVDDKGAKPFCKSGRGESERDSRLSDSSLEGANTQYMHD